MIIVLQPGTSTREIERISKEVRHWNIVPEICVGQHKAVIGLVGDTSEIDLKQIQNLSPAIEQVLRVEKPFKRVSREFRYGEPTDVIVRTPNEDVIFGQNHPLVVVAGPCSVENEDMIVNTALAVKTAGAQFLRGGAYKPRTSPYAFQGHGESALELLAKAREATGLGIITEVMDTADIEKVASVADVLQIGARNMQNFSLLKKVGAAGKPILLKRGLSATIEDLLMAAEYILATGNPNVILCERGVRTFDRQYTRNTLDISAIPVLRTLTHLPIMIDPSHATGKSEFVPTMTMASIAAGTDALMIEVHPNPAKALSDGPQSLTIEAFEQLMQEIASLSSFFGRSRKNNRKFVTPKSVSKVVSTAIV
ncbi:MAG: 3-deoxy-7-phosphoheptulonate synthase [Scytonema sp. PMC 1069.18]|nr:3-deoxy-7-phosphoheptulonate synthase [Scytonema sp. PMC 1069.18]MEC4883325.1 3-deoxy-7-phosphoheptulonate synthase [Scytonema sp. PMC 1070.18]